MLSLECRKPTCCLTNQALGLARLRIQELFPKIYCSFSTPGIYCSAGLSRRGLAGVSKSDDGKQASSTLSTKRKH